MGAETSVLKTIERKNHREQSTARRKDLMLQRVQKTVKALQAQFTNGVVEVQLVTRRQDLTVQRVQKTVLAPQALRLADVNAVTQRQASTFRESTGQCWRRKCSPSTEWWISQLCYRDQIPTVQTRSEDKGNPTSSGNRQNGMSP